MVSTGHGDQVQDPSGQFRLAMGTRLDLLDHFSSGSCQVLGYTSILDFKFQWHCDGYLLVLGVANSLRLSSLP